MPTSYVRVFSGWVYVAFVTDVFSRRIIGWQTTYRPVCTDLAAGALSDMMVLAPERDCALIPLDPHDKAAGMEAPSLQVIGDRDRLS